MSRLKLISLFAWIAVTAFFYPAQAQVGYQLPAPELQAIVDAPRGPLLRIGPQRKMGLLVHLPGLPSITDLNQPEIRLAGLAFNPKTHAASHVDFARNLTLLNINSAQESPIRGLPKKLKVVDIAWSHDEKYIAFTHWTDTGSELWIIDVNRAQARKLISEKLNAIVGTGFSWSAGQLLVSLKPLNQKPYLASKNFIPAISESKGGRATQARTYPDLIKTPQDSDTLDYFLRAQLAWVTPEGMVRRVGKPTILIKYQASPDGNWILATQIKRPYSTIMQIDRFTQVIEVWDKDVKSIKPIAERPMRERLPAGGDAVPTGPREFGWRNDKPATLFWAEAQAGGDPESHARVHDSLYTLSAPFKPPAQKLLDLAWRFNTIYWGDDELALVTETWRKTRDTRTWKIQPSAPDARPEIVFTRKTEDQYTHPGLPVMAHNSWGRSVLRQSQDGKFIYFTGTGASPEGDRPFLDRMDLTTRQSTRVWRSQAPFYEEVIAVLNDKGTRIITSRESNDERPNYYLHDLLNPAENHKALTNFPHPTPQLKGIKKLSLRYTRDDDVELSATIYLPPGYEPKRDGTRPVLIWAYPREFKTSEAASQVSGSSFKFNRISYNSPQVMLARGYVVMDGPSMPIIGEGKREPNDTFIEQLKLNAEAAVDELVRQGIADRHRIAIGGHSYGAFMTANLLAHTRLFRAGIARSGAYNRTLTPFGFQNEDRNFWQAKKTYLEMSPFNYANQIKDPILFIHGEDDSNPGTSPIQSERMYQAVQSMGAITRLVLLPQENHTYRARESIMHMLWEQDRWLQLHVKHARPDPNRD